MDPSRSYVNVSSKIQRPKYQFSFSLCLRLFCLFLSVVGGIGRGGSSSDIFNLSIQWPLSILSLVYCICWPVSVPLSDDQWIISKLSTTEVSRMNKWRYSLKTEFTGIIQNENCQGDILRSTGSIWPCHFQTQWETSEQLSYYMTIILHTQKRWKGEARTLYGNYTKVSPLVFWG